MARRQIDLNALPSNNKSRPNQLRRPEALDDIGGIRTRNNRTLAKEVRSIANTLYDEIIVPAIKAMAMDFGNNGLRALLYRGDPVGTNYPTRRAYNRMHHREEPSRAHLPHQPRREPTRGRTPVYEDVFFDRRGDAELVLGKMMEQASAYGRASIGDLYYLVSLPANFTHENWGWRDLRGCRVVYTSEGYLIDFPDPEPLS